MKFTLEKHNRCLVVSFAGDLDHHGLQTAKERLDDEINLNNIKHLIFNLERVTFMDSSAIGLIIGRFKLAEKNGGSLTVYGLSEDLSRIFELSGLKKIIKIFGSKEEALSFADEFKGA